MSATYRGVARGGKWVFGEFVTLVGPVVVTVTASNIVEAERRVLDLVWRPSQSDMAVRVEWTSIDGVAS